MKEPPRHPGELLVKVLKTLNRSQAWLSRRTGLSTKHINQVCTGVAGIGPRSAVLFEEATGVEAETWMTLQVFYDIAVAREARQDEQLVHDGYAAAREEAARALLAALPVLGSIEPYRRPG